MINIYLPTCSRSLLYSDRGAARSLSLCSFWRHSVIPDSCRKYIANSPRDDNLYEKVKKSREKKNKKKTGPSQFQLYSKFYLMHSEGCVTVLLDL